MGRYYAPSCNQGSGHWIPSVVPSFPSKNQRHDFPVKKHVYHIIVGRRMLTIQSLGIQSPSENMTGFLGYELSICHMYTVRPNGVLFHQPRETPEIRGWDPY